MDGSASPIAHRKATVLRHHLRSAAHRILSDSELVLSETTKPERRLWRDAVGESVIAGHVLRGVVSRWLHASADAPSDSDIAALNDEIRHPQQCIVQSMTSILGLVPTELDDDLLFDDIRAIRDTALSLGNYDPAVAPDDRRRSQPAHLVAPRSTPPGTPAVPRTPRLLVVDDSESSRNVLVALLERMAYDVVAVCDGDDALSAVRRGGFDAVLSDIQMPVMDGFALLRAMKADDATRDIPVIMVSGRSDLKDVVRCVQEGAEDHIAKPLSEVLLRARVHATLERKRLRDDELAVLRQVAELTNAARSVENDTYRPGCLAELGSADDELGRLARVFDRMVSGIRTRESELRHRLTDLKRDIERSRSSVALATPVAEQSSLEPGCLVADRYEILEMIGSGGMGIVYRARDGRLGEEVAMKVVRKELTGDPMLIERLKTEIRLARRLTHANVVRIHDFGEWDGLYFLTMELVRGITVRSLLDTRGRLSVASTLAIGAQLAAALAVAHEQQVIHRDIKPANLLVDEGGVLKLMDFGVARLIEKRREITLIGTVVGTPRYIAPEQLMGGAVDARSDLFAVGVVLYECLTGLPPFDAGMPIALAARMIDGPPIPVLSIVPEVPPALGVLIERLLQFEPDARLQSADELADRLREVH